MSTKVVHRCRMFDFVPCSVNCMAVSKLSDDLAVARSDGSIEIWNTHGNWFVKLVIPGMQGRSVESLTWLANRLISGGLNGDITEYDLSTTSVKVTVDSYGGAVWCMSPSPNEDKIAVGCEDGSVKLFDAQNKSISYEKTFDKQEGRILSIAWHEEGDVLVTGSVDVIRMWSTKTGRALQRITIDRQMKNVETIVWCLLILRDYTIVSGDSSGRVQFWDGKNSSQIQSFHVHRADVLCMCTHPNGQSIFAAGVDPRVFQFSLINTTDGLNWVKGNMVLKHTHDIRAVEVIKDKIVSGGVDTNIMTNSLHTKLGKFQRFHSFPSRSLVSHSAHGKLLLFQYKDKLELWRTGKPAQTAGAKTGHSLAIEEQPTKILELRKPKSEINQIMCSAISKCGNWIVYSTLKTVRIYRIKINMDKLDIQRVKCVGLIPSHTLLFTPDSKRLILSTIEHKILLAEIDAETAEIRLLQMFSTKSPSTHCNLLAVSPDSTLLATANLESEIVVYDLMNMTDFCSLPRASTIPTAMLFHPSLHTLLVVYDNMQVFEFCLKNFKYTNWTRKILSMKHNSLLESIHTTSKLQTSRAVVNQLLLFQSQESEEIYFVSKDGIYVIERTREGEQIKGKNRFCHNFSPIMFCDAMDADSIVIVERPMQDIWSQLPPTLYQKKFGT